MAVDNISSNFVHTIQNFIRYCACACQPSAVSCVLSNCVIPPLDGQITDIELFHNFYRFSYAAHLRGKCLLNRTSFKANKKFNETDKMAQTDQFCNCERNLRKSTHLQLSLKFNTGTMILCLKRPS